MEIIRNLFIPSQDSIRDPLVDQFYWEEGPQSGNLQIESSGKLDLAEANTAAKIVVRLGKTEVLASAGDHDFIKQEGCKRYEEVVTETRVTVHCIAETHRLASRMASTIFLQLRQNSKLLKARYEFSNFVVQGTTETKTQNANTYTTGVPVGVHAKHSCEIDLSQFDGSLDAPTS